MGKIYCCFALLLPFLASAQLVTFNGTGGLPVPPGAPSQTVGVTSSPCAVSGIGVIGGCVSIDNVTMDLEHSWVGDIGILLIGPGGQVLELSTGNGGAGNNYTNTVFTDNTADFITTGTPPYTGVFRPEGRVQNLANPYSNAPALGTFTFANVYNGTNADGTWQLYIYDYVAADVGVLNSWSITFNQNGIPPNADAGPDVNICQGNASTLTASGGDTYLWSTGATTASISVNPTVTTIYTVTVTQAGCGSDTDEVTVNVSTPPQISLEIPANNNLCQGGCETITANVVGTPPFSFTWQFQLGGNLVGTTQTASGGSSPISFNACPPGGPGAYQLVICSVSDLFCNTP